MHEHIQGVDLSSIEQAKTAVRYNAETDLTWRHHELAKQLYGWTDIFRDRFLDPIARLDRQGRLPGPVIGFDRDDVRTLAYYILGKNAYGIDDAIILNELNLDRPLYSVLETVLHEQVHLWQQRFGEHPVKRNYHNQEFVQKCESLGLHPFPILGFHWQPADGAFEQLLKEHLILKPQGELVFPVSEGQKRNWWQEDREKGRSTLVLYQCPCGQRVRVGKQDWPGATCHACGESYSKVGEAQNHPSQSAR